MSKQKFDSVIEHYKAIIPARLALLESSRSLRKHVEFESSYVFELNDGRLTSFPGSLKSILKYEWNENAYHQLVSDARFLPDETSLVEFINSNQQMFISAVKAIVHGRDEMLAWVERAFSKSLTGDPLSYLVEAPIGIGHHHERSLEPQTKVRKS